MEVMEVMSMDLQPTKCWFCGRPVLIGERAHRPPHGRIAVHADCLRDDALQEGMRPGGDDLPGVIAKAS